MRSSREHRMRENKLEGYGLTGATPSGFFRTFKLIKPY